MCGWRFSRVVGWSFSRTVHGSHRQSVRGTLARSDDRATMRRHTSRTTRPHRGAASVETVFVVAILALLFFGAVEFARVISVKHALDVGTYRAARYLSLIPNDTPTATQMVRQEVQANVLGGGLASRVVVTVDMPSTVFQTAFTVTSQVAYQPVVPFMLFAPKTLTVTHGQNVEAYP